MPGNENLRRRAIDRNLNELIQQRVRRRTQFGAGLGKLDFPAADRGSKQGDTLPFQRGGQAYFLDPMIETHALKQVLIERPGRAGPSLLIARNARYLDDGWCDFSCR